ncbi:pilus assembly protein TadG-related protein [Agromyces sp. MMS24-JH15]|uniref:pilus assembly protein TadG-related protein n=1 Tax=Agromyces sp. MMS24-JH15 TaxID=3243765 RepID=UPI003747F978
MTRLARLREEDAGSTLVLTVCYGMLGIVLILVVAAATSLYLERKRLFTVADGAALAAAESWGMESVHVDDGRLGFALTADGVRAAASDYLADTESGLQSMELARADVLDGRTASVTLHARWVAPISTEFLPIEVPIEVTATARSVFH